MTTIRIDQMRGQAVAFAVPAPQTTELLKPIWRSLFLLGALSLPVIGGTIADNLAHDRVPMRTQALAVSRLPLDETARSLPIGIVAQAWP